MRCALVLLALATAPAAAQETGCPAQWDQMRAVLGEQFGVEIIAEELSVDGGACVASSVTQLGQDRVVPSAREVRWRGVGLDSFVATGVLPERITIEARKLAAIPVFEHSPSLSWVYRVQSLRTGVDVVMELVLDHTSGAIDLERLSFDFIGDNRIDLQARMTGVDLSDSWALQASAGEAALSAYRLRVESHGLFETLALPALGPAILDGVDDPAAELARMKALAAGWLALLPDDLLAAESRDALIRLIGTLPHPNGVLEIRMQAEPPLGARRGLALATDPDFDPLKDVARLMDGVALSVTYDHTPFRP